MLYLHVAFAVFMSYVLSPTLQDEGHARVVYESLFFFGDRKAIFIRWAVFVTIVFGVGYAAFVIMDPATKKQALVDGLGVTSLASMIKTTGILALRSTPHDTRPSEPKHS